MYKSYQGQQLGVILTIILTDKPLMIWHSKYSQDVKKTETVQRHLVYHHERQPVSQIIIN